VIISIPSNPFVLKFLNRIEATEDGCYKMYNADDRPDGATNRSMTIGDVISIAWDEATIHSYAVRTVGFERVELS